jgi:hypothetical protein
MTGGHSEILERCHNLNFRVAESFEFRKSASAQMIGLETDKSRQRRHPQPETVPLLSIHHVAFSGNILGEFRPHRFDDHREIFNHRNQ